MSVAIAGNSLRQHLLAAAQHLRALCATAARPPELWAISIKLRRDKVLEVEFNSGERFTYPAEYLRVESPSAEALDAQGQPKVVHGRREVGIMSIEPVGSYAVRLRFDDLHGSGIYTWRHLHDLGMQKLSRMRRYIWQLRERGLSRDPPRRRAGTSAAQPRQVHSGQQPQQADGGGGTSSGGTSGTSI